MHLQRVVVAGDVEAIASKMQAAVIEMVGQAEADMNEVIQQLKANAHHKEAVLVSEVCAAAALAKGVKELEKVAQEAAAVQSSDGCWQRRQEDLLAC